MAPRAKPAAQTVLDPAEHFTGTSNQFPIANGSPLIDDEEEFEQSPADRIAVMLGELRGDDRAKVKLYKLDSGQAAWCEDFTPEAYEDGGLPMIRVKWGPGTYRVVLYGSHGGGQYGIRARAEVRLMPEASDAPRVAGNEDRVIAAITQSSQSQMEMMRALIDKLSDRPDPTAQMTQTFALMTQMREAMGINTATAAAPSISQVLDDLRKMQKAAQDFGKPAEPEKKDDDLLTMLAPLLPKLLESVQNRGGQINAQPMPHIALPASFAVGPVATPAPELAGAAPVASAPSENPQTPDDDEAEVMKMYSALMFYYNGLAKRGSDPIAAAATFYDQIPDEGLTVLQSDGWWEPFLAFSPGSAPYREWFTKVRDEIVRLIAEDAKEEASGPAA
jgi:hypothetical protein